MKNKNAHTCIQVSMLVRLRKQKSYCICSKFFLHLKLTWNLLVKYNHILLEKCNYGTLHTQFLKRLRGAVLFGYCSSTPNILKKCHVQIKPCLMFKLNISLFACGIYFIYFCSFSLWVPIVVELTVLAKFFD